MRNLIMPLVAIIALAQVLSTTPAHADLLNELFKLQPDDGAEFDYFGFSIAIDGTNAVIGAPLDDDNGINSGSAYIYDSTTGEQIAKLLPDDGSVGNQFGFSVAISGTTVVIGAPHGFGNSELSGCAYVFDISDPKNPVQINKLIAKDGEFFDLFGSSVAVKGTAALIGAPHDNDNGLHSGSAYVFSTTLGIQTAKLLPNDGEQFDSFGGTVDISSPDDKGKRVAVIGAIGDDDNGNSSGSAYIFDTGQGFQIAKLLPKDGVENDWFGFSVAINNSYAIVGAPNNTDECGKDSGSVYIFSLPLGQQIAEFNPSKCAPGDFSAFGRSVALSSNTVIIGGFGAKNNDLFFGQAYTYDISDPFKPIHSATLLPSEGEAFEQFGRAVSISGTIALVGVFWPSDIPEVGSAYLFDTSASPKCPWDLDKNGSVGTGDLLELLAQWGTAGSADFDESGEVGTGDLLILLANWGPCK